MTAPNMSEYVRFDNVDFMLYRVAVMDGRAVQQHVFPGRRRDTVGERSKWLTVYTLPDERAGVGPVHLMARLVQAPDLYYFEVVEQRTDAEPALYLACHGEHWKGAYHEKGKNMAVGYSVHSHPHRNEDAQWRLIQVRDQNDDTVYKISPLRKEGFFLTVAAPQGPERKHRPTWSEEGDLVVWQEDEVAECASVGGVVPDLLRMPSQGFQWKIEAGDAMEG